MKNIDGGGDDDDDNGGNGNSYSDDNEPLKSKSSAIQMKLKRNVTSA